MTEFNKLYLIFKDFYKGTKFETTLFKTFMCSARDIALHSAQSLDFKNYTQCLSKLKLGLGNSTNHMDSILCDSSNPFIVIKALFIL